MERIVHCIIAAAIVAGLLGALIQIIRFGGLVESGGIGLLGI